MAIPIDFKAQLLEKLKERHVKPLCELCGQNNWAVVDQAISIQITDLSGTVRIPAPQVPCAGLVCNNCGNFRLFSLGALGMLPKPEEGK